MAYEINENTGSLFVNEKKETDNHPDRQGSALIEGVEYWVSGWLKKSKEGKPWLSLSFRPKVRLAGPLVTRGNAPQRDDRSVDLDDEIPF